MTSWGKSLRSIALVFGGALLLVGCGNAETSTSTGTAVPSTTTSAATKSADPDAGLWDPCGLPESAITAAGLDSATKAKDVAGVDFTGWKVCSWRATAKWYSLGVLSGTPTLDEIRKRPDFEKFTPLTVGNHQAVEFLDVGDAERFNCTIAVELPRGTVMFYARTRYSVGKQGEPCDQARSNANGLVKYLPGS